MRTGAFNGNGEEAMRFESVAAEGMAAVRKILGSKEMLLCITRGTDPTAHDMARAQAVFDREHELNCVVGTVCDQGRWIAPDFLFKNLLLPSNADRVHYVVFRPEDIANDTQALTFLRGCDDPVYGLCLILMRSGYLFACTDAELESAVTHTNIQIYLSYLLEEYLLSEEYADKLQSYLKKTEPVLLPEAVEKLQNQREENLFLGERRNIMIVSPDLNTGGGQMLAVRIANFLSVYHNVFLCNTRPEFVQQNMVGMLSRGVILYNYTGSAADFSSFLRKNHIEIINSHIWWSDKLVYFAQKYQRIGRWVLCMHGCYEALLDDPALDPMFPQIGRELLNMPAHIVYATDKNTRVFKDYSIANAENRLHKIHYGYQRQNIPAASKADLSIDTDSLIFGMVARGIPEKGWQQAIDAIIRLHAAHKCDLILVASGDYIDRLQEAYAAYPFIHFFPGNDYPSQWISYVRIFDVCLLPTYFVSETLPNTIIEYLAYDKPVIATDIGDIPQMLFGAQGKDAGLLLTLKAGTVDADELYEKMLLLTENTDLRHKLAGNARNQFAQYEMNRFISSYFALFLNDQAPPDEGRDDVIDSEAATYLMARLCVDTKDLKVESLHSKNLIMRDGVLFGENNDPHFSIRLDRPISQMTVILKGTSSISTNKIKLYFGNDFDFSEERTQNIGDFRSEECSALCDFKQDVNTIRVDLGDYDASYNIQSLRLGQVSRLAHTKWKFLRRIKKLWSIFRLACQNKTLRQKGFQKMREVGLKNMLYMAAGLVDVGPGTGMEVTGLNAGGSKNKILVCIHDMEQAGAQTLTLRIVKSLNQDYGYQVALLTLKGGKMKNDFSQYAAIYNLNQATIAGIDAPNRFRELVLQLKEEGYSKAICNSASTGTLCGALSDLGFYCISLVHELPTSILHLYMEESASELTRTARSIIFASQFVKDGFCSLFDPKEERMKIIPQCVVKPDRLDKAAARQRLKEQAGIDPNKKLVLGSGYGDIRKGIELFCQTAIQYRNRYGEGLQFIWTGVIDQALYPWLMDDLKKAGIAQDVFLLNRFVSDVNIYFSAADVFLLTSREDPFPSVVLEAMYCGVPTVAFCGSGGMNDLLRDGMGFLVDYLDVAQMAEALHTCLADTQAYQALSARLHDHADKNYDTKDYVKALLRELGEAKGFNQTVTQAYQVQIRKPLEPKRKKILHVIDNFVTGGSSKLVVDIYEWLGHQYEQRVLVNNINDPVDYEGIPCTVFRLTAAREDVLKCIETFSPDVIHVHYWGSVWYDWVMDILSGVKGCRVIENVNIPIKPYAAPFIDKYVYVSDYVLQTFGAEPEKSTFIYPGSDFSFFTRSLPAGYLARDTIGMVYRLDSDKLTDDSIDVFIRTVQKRPQTKALIVGGGPRFEQYYNKVQQAGVLERFIFTGYVPYSELPSYYAQMSIFVAPVWKESFGQVSPFAMSMGLPVCGYDIGALHEIIGDESLLAKFEEIEALSDILVQLLDNPERCERIGQANQIRANERFDLPTMIKSYEALYATIGK